MSDYLSARQNQVEMRSELRGNFSPSSGAKWYHYPLNEISVRSENEYYVSAKIVLEDKNEATEVKGSIYLGTKVVVSRSNIGDS